MSTNVMLTISGLLVLLLAGVAETYVDQRRSLREKALRWPTTLCLFLINGSLSSFVAGSTFVLSASGFVVEGSPLNVSQLHWAWQVVVWLLCTSLAGYAMHRLSHTVPILWKLHRVHHGDSLLDVTTGFRHHPVDGMIVAIVFNLVAALVAPSPYVIFAAGVLDMIFSIWSHSALHLPPAIDRIVRLVWITPRMHELHHSDDHRETNTNYGTVFAFWDRVFGSYRDHPLDASKPINIGLPEFRHEKAEDLIWILKSPLD
jgi:sterol desaturase/sphingolipid hydroxylase (fatty acid hydroxylase superfamily)